MPKIGKGKAKGWLYPDEDRKLLASAAVPLAWRVLYGFLDREGPRFSEAAALDVADIDLDRGAVKLDENKTDDARAWALSPGVAPALAAWVAHREKATGARFAPSAPLFVDENGARVTDEKIDLAKQFRAHLIAAKIDRAELFERTASRVHIRLHDTRATFVTISLANGRSETWVADRTGHRSSTMINKYRRAARTAEELGLGELARLDRAIPELRAEDDEGDDGEGLDGADEVSTGSVYQEAADSTSSGSGAWIRTMIRGFKDAPDGCETSLFSAVSVGSTPRSATSNSAWAHSWAQAASSVPEASTGSPLLVGLLPPLVSGA